MSALFDISFEAITAFRFGRFQMAYDAAPGGFAGNSVRAMAALRLGLETRARALAPSASSADAASQLSLAALAENDRHYDEAERRIERAIQIEHASFVPELVPLLPAEEALGDLRLDRGDAADAVTAFSAALAAYPNDPRALFGLARAVAAEGETAREAATRTQFEKEWKGADTQAVDALL